MRVRSQQDLFSTDAEKLIKLPILGKKRPPMPIAKAQSTISGAISGGEAKGKLSPRQSQELLRVLQARFEKNMDRHQGIKWIEVQAKLDANTERLQSLNEMERTGGERAPCFFSGRAFRGALRV